MPRRITTLLVAFLVMAATLSTPAFAASSSSDIGWHIPWAIGGPRLAEDGSVYQHPGEWPDFPVEAVRLWDTRTAWLNLEPKQGVFDFTNLDAHLDKARTQGVRHVTLVLAGTPRWAAKQTRDADAPWMGPGSASPPADMSQWRTYVAAVASRYRGRIQAYEIGNEPNLQTFWSGTSQEMADLVRSSAEVIRSVDPEAMIVAPAPLITSESDVAGALQLWRAIDDVQLDVDSFHWYPRDPVQAARFPRILKKIQQGRAELRTSSPQLWITEANPEWWATPRSLRMISRDARLAGVQRIYWYAWMHGPATNLWDFTLR